VPPNALNALPEALLRLFMVVIGSKVPSATDLIGLANEGRHRARPTERAIAMYAVIKTGGKQYRVAMDDVISIEKLEGDARSSIEFEDVLMVGEGASVKVGAPTVSGAKVVAELVEQTRGPKVIAFKKRRRQNSRRKRGHRQDLTKIRITSIVGA